MNETPGPNHYLAAAEFVLMLRQTGLYGTRVLRAMEQVPRVPFLDQRWFALADEDIALPIACGQSILPPSLTALMIDALGVEPAHRVLQVGTGSGYSAAILGRLAASVITVERWRTLADQAHARLRGLGYDMIETVFGDGLDGHPPRAPYDRILVTCAMTAIPAGLSGQLAPGGVLVAPLGDGAGAQDIVRVVRGPEGLVSTAFSRARVEPAVSGVARRL
ncbi:protein-L-isoaspartate O-methyltransferase family protein [Phreatobacter stygius]|uniref:Protein-L-isoaspartate O-methyltransferase n=1 Tax=Phreatobacter stygius TaxID=1940610 RepID=A0A4D7BE16_9HYPH|nr:protein-L-isoaspartate O-methyltransferase [Phreatobacter stygius]QCI68743.1 protein-L-isoaspartate O-methyltransferase [Phreatobacter stygius]